MSVWSVLPMTCNFNHFLKKSSLYSTSNRLSSSPMTRKFGQVNFRGKIAAPIYAIPYKSVWGDHFLSYISVEPTLGKDDMISHEKLKEEVRNMLIGCPTESETLELIDGIQRLGVEYHFRTEIEQILSHIMDKTKSCPDVHEDLHTVSLKFRLLRQDRHNISCDVFNKFTDSNGQFKDAIAKDARGMLSLLEATPLRTWGDKILDEALSFTTAHLKTMATKVDSPLSNQINNALDLPYYMGIPRLEAWKHIHTYKGNDTLLTFAKLDFNLLQKLHQKEVAEMTRWWVELDICKKVPFVRDRLVECYIWALGFYFEPEFSLARKMSTKAVLLSSVLDDIYDDYAPLEELELFTAAFERWNLSEMKHLPEYMQVLFKLTLDVYSEFDEIFAMQGKSYRSYYARESMKIFIRGDLLQASWLLKGHMPTMDEYKDNVLGAIGWPLFLLSSLLGMDDPITKHSFGWAISDPKIVRDSSLLTRYIDDIVDFKTGDSNCNVYTSVDCYAHNNNCTKEEAVEALKIENVNLIKQINEEALKLKSIPLSVILRILGINRVTFVLYRDIDNYTHAGGIMKDYISALLEDPIPV